MTFSDASSVDKVLAHGSHDLDGKKVEYSLDISSSSVIYLSFSMHEYIYLLQLLSILPSYCMNICKINKLSLQIDWNELGGKATPVLSITFVLEYEKYSF